MDRRAFFSGISALALVGCAGAGKAPQAASGGMMFSEAERRLITEYFARERALRPNQPAPPQSAKPGDKLVSGSRPSHLPDALKARLGHLPDPYTRLVLGADVILVNRDTHDIADVIPQVVY